MQADGRMTCDAEQQKFAVLVLQKRGLTNFTAFRAAMQPFDWTMATGLQTENVLQQFGPGRAAILTFSSGHYCDCRFFLPRWAQKVIFQ
jgi:hypothetical protein